ncbi:DUF58 domain-containing protein [Novipirellula artificiosorum]|uniref:DUF58 domain-containing protein n=1 Tax=Novipirellula artificiosorum TaxID=2528016 RepID=A0A5C6DN09_9BACT|nr:DUF58 domain-containing protein [Novipirellula artificiosorum]TWU38220.1 hypothetical protein Poly41_26960 [Novipirellula artificiosorum]
MIQDAVTQLSLLELRCRRPVEHLLSGEYRSVFRGQGIEFEDVRQYQPGDDVRAMDWKVTARTGEPHIRRYIEQREQFLYLLVDLSSSILTASNGRKRALIAELGSLLTMAALRNNDRVSLILFTDCVELMIPPGKGTSQGLRIMDALLNFRPQGHETRFSNVLSHFGHLARKRSIAFVLSDFFAADYLEELRALAHRHDMNAVNVLDPPSQASSSTELVFLQDAESGENRHIDLRKHHCRDQSHHLTLQEEMLQSGVDLMEIAVGEDCVTALTSFFRSRQRRVADETGG